MSFCPRGQTTPPNSQDFQEIFGLDSARSHSYDPLLAEQPCLFCGVCRGWLVPKVTEVVELHVVKEGSWRINAVFDQTCLDLHNEGHCCLRQKT